MHTVQTNLRALHRAPRNLPHRTVDARTIGSPARHPHWSRLQARLQHFTVRSVIGSHPLPDLHLRKAISPAQWAHCHCLGAPAARSLSLSGCASSTLWLCRSSLRMAVVGLPWWASTATTHSGALGPGGPSGFCNNNQGWSLLAPSRNGQRFHPIEEHRRVAVGDAGRCDQTTEDLLFVEGACAQGPH